MQQQLPILEDFLLLWNARSQHEHDTLYVAMAWDDIAARGFGSDTHHSCSVNLTPRVCAGSKVHRTTVQRAQWQIQVRLVEADRRLQVTSRIYTRRLTNGCTLTARTVNESLVVIVNVPMLFPRTPQATASAVPAYGCAALDADTTASGASRNVPGRIATGVLEFCLCRLQCCANS